MQRLTKKRTTFGRGAHYFSRGDKTQLELFVAALSHLQTSDPVAFAGLKSLIGQARKQLK